MTGQVIRSSKLDPIRDGGWRALGRGAGDNRDRKHGIGYDYVHSLVDDNSRLAYSESTTTLNDATQSSMANPDQPTDTKVMTGYS